jgi:hypothetical protein
MMAGLLRVGSVEEEPKVSEHIHCGNGLPDPAKHSQMTLGFSI